MAAPPNGYQVTVCSENLPKAKVNVGVSFDIQGQRSLFANSPKTNKKSIWRTF